VEGTPTNPRSMSHQKLDGNQAVERHVDRSQGPSETKFSPGTLSRSQNGYQSDRVVASKGNRYKGLLDCFKPNCLRKTVSNDVNSWLLPQSLLGVPLIQYVKNSITNPNHPDVPGLVSRSIDYLNIKRGYLKQNLFSTRGNPMMVKNLISDFNLKGDFRLLDLNGITIYDVANVLKVYFQSLSDSFFGNLQTQFSALVTLPNAHIQQAQLQSLISQLPKIRVRTLQILFQFLHKFIKNHPAERSTLWVNFGFPHYPHPFPFPLFEIMVLHAHSIFSNGLVDIV
jgi:hypothetical protein